MVEFDENDFPLMDEIAANIQGSTLAAFDPLVRGNLCEEAFSFNCRAIQHVSDNQLLQFVDLVDVNLREFYLKTSGKDWKQAKRKEMLENGLVYTWYEADDGSVAAFISYKLCYDECAECKVLYLYEIHVDPRYQGSGLGLGIMSSFHKLVQQLQLTKQPHFHDLGGTSLTVFPTNVMACQWYFKLGYTFSDGSPLDKVLRTGRVIKPAYYILVRLI